MLPLSRLGAAVTGLSTARGALLDAVGDVQDGASAIDATDAVCAQGHGIAARDSQQQGAPAVARASAAVRDLPGLVANYRAALAALDKARTAVTGQPRTALAAVVRDGDAEATAIGQFDDVVRGAWPQYVLLDSEERLWIHRSVTPWYRTDKEGADAYSVMVGPGRPSLTAARARLSEQAAAVRTPSSVQTATLAAADRALSTLRSRR